MKLNPKLLFQIDFIGALLSAILLGLVLPALEAYIGMPKNILYLLAIIAIFLAFYSFFNYRKTPQRWQPYLKAVAIANLLYCCLTLSLVLYQWTILTTLGKFYFFLEMLIIIGLVVIELNFALKNKRV